MKFKNKKILLGITGSIAIYKAADLLRKLTKNYGADVQVIMTNSALRFMSPLVFETFSGKNVYSSIFDEGYVGTRHIDFAKEADIVLICPATANIIAKTAAGIADDLLSTIILAAGTKTVFAPAMNVNMYKNPATMENMDKLKKIGYGFIDSETGMLACNDIGKGKLTNIDKILEYLNMTLNGTNKLKGKKVLVTAGPTREYLDPVRYISNRSSGKMGLALAEEAKKEGAEVLLVTGPVSIDIPNDLETIKVESAIEMRDTLIQNSDSVDFLFMAAAIEDLCPAEYIDTKIKKNDTITEIPIKLAPDIVSEFRQKNKKTCIVGFSVEMNDGKERSINKMQKKGLDYIVWNNPKDDGVGFEHDTNEVTLFSQNGHEWFLSKNSKRNIAENIIKIITESGKNK